MNKIREAKIGLRIIALAVLFTFVFSSLSLPAAFASKNSNSNPWITLGTAAVFGGLSMYGIKAMPAGYGLFRGLTQPFAQGAIYGGLKSTGMDKATAFWTAAVSTSLAYSAGCPQLRPEGFVRPGTAIFKGGDLAKTGLALMGRDFAVSATTAGVQALGIKYLSKEYKKQPWMEPLVDLMAVGVGAGVSGMYAKAFMHGELKSTASNRKPEQMKISYKSGATATVTNPGNNSILSIEVVEVKGANGQATGETKIRVTHVDADGNATNNEYANTAANQRMVGNRLQTAYSQSGATASALDQKGRLTTYSGGQLLGLRKDISKIPQGATIEYTTENAAHAPVTTKVKLENNADLKEMQLRIQNTLPAGTKVKVIYNGKEAILYAGRPEASTLSKVFFGNKAAYPSLFVETTYLNSNSGYASAFWQGVKSMGPGYYVQQLAMTSVYFVAQQLDKDFKNNKPMYGAVGGALGGGIGGLADTAYYQRLVNNKDKKTLGYACFSGFLNGAVSGGMEWGREGLEKQGVSFNSFQWNTTMFGISTLTNSAAAALLTDKPSLQTVQNNKKDKEGSGLEMITDNGEPYMPPTSHWEVFKYDLYNTNASLFEDMVTFGRNYNNVMAGLGKDSLYYAQVNDFAYDFGENGAGAAAMNYAGNKMHYHAASNFVNTGTIVSNAILHPENLATKADFMGTQGAQVKVRMPVVNQPNLFETNIKTPGWMDWIMNVILPDKVYGKYEDLMTIKLDELNPQLQKDIRKKYGEEVVQQYNLPAGTPLETAAAAALKALEVLDAQLGRRATPPEKAAYLELIFKGKDSSGVTYGTRLINGQASGKTFEVTLPTLPPEARSSRWERFVYRLDPRF